MGIFKSMDEFERTFFPREYERKRRANLSPRELATEDVKKCFEKIRKEVLQK